MMSTHDVAVAALNEVASHQRSESRVGDSAIPRSMGGGTATSIEASTSTSKNAPIADIRESNASFGFQSSSSNNSQTTVPDATTPPSSDGFSSQSQQSPSQPSQHSQPSATQLAHSRLADTAVLTPLVATSAGQKRTLDGHVKLSGSSSNSSASPPVGPLSVHSRNISSASSAISSREVWDLSFCIASNFAHLRFLDCVPELLEHSHATQLVKSSCKPDFIQFRDQSAKLVLQKTLFFDVAGSDY
jgi:hypothetical protein